MRYAIYDNNGKTYDRYTLRILASYQSGYSKHFNAMYGFNEDPFHPQGFGQYCGEYELSRSYKHLGKLIKLSSLPEQAQKYVNQILKDYEEIKQ